MKCSHLNTNVVAIYSFGSYNSEVVIGFTLVNLALLFEFVAQVGRSHHTWRSFAQLKTHSGNTSHISTINRKHLKFAKKHIRCCFLSLPNNIVHSQVTLSFDTSSLGLKYFWRKYIYIINNKLLNTFLSCWLQIFLHICKHIKRMLKQIFTSSTRSYA